MYLYITISTNVKVLLESFDCVYLFRSGCLFLHWLVLCENEKKSVAANESGGIGGAGTGRYERAAGEQIGVVLEHDLQYCAKRWRRRFRIGSGQTAIAPHLSFRDWHYYSVDSPGLLWNSGAGKSSRCHSDLPAKYSHSRKKYTARSAETSSHKNKQVSLDAIILL